MTDDFQPPRSISHGDRYEGWKDDRGDTVKRFDGLVEYRWVQLDIDDIPDEVVDERRSTADRKDA